MAKKSKSKKSKSKKATSDAPRTEEDVTQGKAAWTTDDVYRLLDAVNRVTLGRIEEKINALTQKVTLVQDQANVIKNQLDFDLRATRQTADAIFTVMQNPLIVEVRAIKAKTDRLP